MRRNLHLLRSYGRQKGIVGVFAIVFILLVVIVSLTQTLAISASNITDTSRQADSIEALFLAESAMENVAARVIANPGTWTCDDTFMGVGEAAVALGRGTFEILDTDTTDFTGGTLDTGLCRVKVRGQITSSKVARTLETIVGKLEDSISISSLNPNFNDPPWGCSTCDVTETRDQDFAHAPNQWGLTGGTQGLPYIGWDNDGGPDGSRAAFARKTTTGTGAATAGGAFTPGTPILINMQAGLSKTLRLTFDFRVWTKGASNQEFQFSPTLRMCTDYPTCSAIVVYQPDAIAAGGDCHPGGTVRWCESGNTCENSSGSLCKTGFTVPREPRQSNGPAPNGCGYIDTTGFESGPDNGIPPAEESPTECATYTPPFMDMGYRTGYLTYTIPNSGAAQVQLLSIKFEGEEATPVGRMKGKEGQITWMWVDNLRLTVPSLEDASPNKMWREVSF